jgi:hypothetical protein
MLQHIFVLTNLEMYSGYLYHGKESFGPKVIMASAADGAEVNSSPSGYDARQLYSRECRSGVAFGSNGGRSAYCAHIGGCDGILCSCHNVLTHFLGHADADTVDHYVYDNTSYLKENVKFPYLLLFSDGTDFLSVTAYAAHDFHVSKLEDGHYLIR